MCQKQEAFMKCFLFCEIILFDLKKNDHVRIESNTVTFSKSTWLIELNFVFFLPHRCIKTFELEFSADSNEFKRVNSEDTIFTSFVYMPGEREMH